MPKLFYLIPVLMLCAGLACPPVNRYFPEKNQVLAPGWVKFKNFLPLVTLDLRNRGIRDPIHVIYVSFDPAIDHKAPFPRKDNIDAFTFKIGAGGYYVPLFDSTALRIGPNFAPYFSAGEAKYEQTKRERQHGRGLIDFAAEPEWWQQDETPRNSQGKKFTFICQLDMFELFGDDCRLYVFYDAYDRVVKHLYQRT